MTGRAGPTSTGGASRETVAALDLGSNSFHMVIAREVDGDLVVVDRLKETVRLAAGLGRKRKLGKKAQQRALACLERFAERLRGVDPARWRAVGTNALRRARDAEAFRERAEEVLGHPIEIVSGQEEARLIYLAVARDLHDAAGRTLVADIGGGSTEIILGEGREMEVAHSLYLGCVGSSEAHFADGAMDKARFKSAETAARLELQAIERALRRRGWERCVGTSGTINAIHEIVRLAGWGAEGVTPDALRRLRKAMIRAGHTDALDLEGLGSDRRAVLPGGVAILEAVFDGLGIESMTVSQAALREGVLYDLVGRLHRDDARDRTIRRLVDRYRVDEAQARRVEATAGAALDQVATAWGLDAVRAASVLSWSAWLHEIGLGVAYSGHHKHGAYLIANSFLPGFSADDQNLVASIVRGQRRKVAASVFDPLPPDERETALRLCVLLRLAVLLNRGRARRPVPPLRVTAEGSRIAVALPAEWLADRPLTAADLAKEADYLSAVGLTLEVTAPQPLADG